MRNPNGFGTVVCLDKTGKKRRKPWAVRVTIGWVDGKQKTKYIGYYENQVKANIALAEFNSKNISLDANIITFQDIFNMWKEKKTGKLTDANLKAYEAAYKLVPQLHSKKLKDLKSTHLQDAMDSVNRKHSSRVKLKSLMKQMYDIAMMDDLISKDYSAGVELKTKQEEVGNVYTNEQINNLWSLPQDEIVENILILIYTGMRIGEALAVNPSTDINLEERYIACHGTKTDSAERPIPIHPDILPILEKRVVRTSLFTNQRGQKATYRTFLYAYQAFLKEQGWEHVVHDTRKTCATVLYENGIPDSDIKTIIGHKHSDVTHKVYVKHRIEVLVNKMNGVTFK